MKFSFIHAADIHLDSPFQGLADLPTHIREKVMHSTFRALDHLVQYALQAKVDFVIFAGDIYDRAERSLRAQLQLKRGLQPLAEAGIAVYIVHGNHDPVQGEYIDLDWPEQIHFFDTQKVERVPFYRQGEEIASVYGISYAQAYTTNNLARFFQKESEAFSIGVLHTNCDGAPGHANYAPCSTEDLLQSKMDYWALGHVHTRQVLHMDPAIVYPGNIQGRHIREQGERGFYHVQVNGSDQVHLSFQKAADVLWLEHTLDMTDMDTMGELLGQMEEERAQLRRDHPHVSIMLRLIGKGSTALAEKLAQREVIEDVLNEWRADEDNKDPFVWPVDFDFRGIPAYDREALKAGDGLYADALSLLDAWASDAQQRSDLYGQPIRELTHHGRARKYLTAFSEEEQQQILRRVESILFTEWLKEDRR